MDLFPVQVGSWKVVCEDCLLSYYLHTRHVGYPVSHKSRIYCLVQRNEIELHVRFLYDRNRAIHDGSSSRYPLIRHKEVLIPE